MKNKRSKKTLQTVTNKETLTTQPLIFHRFLSLFDIFLLFVALAHRNPCLGADDFQVFLFIV